MNPFFVFQFIRNLATRKKEKKKGGHKPDYTRTKYYRGQDYDEHVYDRGEDRGLKDGEESEKERD